MNTKQIMELAVKLAALNDVSSHVYVPCENVKKALFGIDIDERDIFFAKHNGYDLVISHHSFIFKDDLDSFGRHFELMVSAGVNPTKAKVASDYTFNIIRNNFNLYNNGNQNIAIKKAEELGVGLMNIHMPCDEIGRVLLQKTADEIGQEKKVYELIKRYSKIPEIRKSKERVRLVCGDLNSRIGKVKVIHGAGSWGNYPITKALFEAGINTVVCVDMFSEEKEKLKKECGGNLIITGQFSSDSMGINPLINQLEDRNIKIDCCNRLIRISKRPIKHAVGNIIFKFKRLRSMLDIRDCQSLSSIYYHDANQHFKKLEIFKGIISLFFAWRYNEDKFKFYKYHSYFKKIFLNKKIYTYFINKFLVFV